MNTPETHPGQVASQDRRTPADSPAPRVAASVGELERDVPNVSDHSQKRIESVVPRHIRGIDALRFWLAMMVVFSHCGFVPVPEGWMAEGTIFRALYHNLINGPAAVIVFFVISGFCIHYPHRDIERLALLPYFARRHIRILLPVAVAVMIGQPLGWGYDTLSNTILWSLVCEEIYYTIYPLLHHARSHVPLVWQVALAFVAAYATVFAFAKPIDGNYQSLGFALTWIVGLPCWLLGALVAERLAPERQPHVSTRKIWCWRLGMLAASAVFSAVRFHTPLTYPYTLDLFAIAAFFWLQAEIAHAAPNRRPPSLWERAGLFSYSIYLVHLHGEALWRKFNPSWRGSLVEWLAMYAFILAFCFLFFLLCERPAHRLARSTFQLVQRALNQRSIRKAARGGVT